MTEIVIDTSVTMEGGFHPALIKSGPFTGTAFVILDLSIDENSKIIYQYSIVRGDIMDNRLPELEQIIQTYIQQSLKNIMEGRE